MSFMDMEKEDLEMIQEIIQKRMNSNFDIHLGKELLRILKNNTKKDMKIIKNLAINSMYLILFIGIVSCSQNANKNINVSLIEIFEVYPKINNEDKIAIPGQLQLTLEFINNTDQNYYFEFDSWLKERKDSLNCFFTVKCENNETMKLSLGNVTYPKFLLPNHSIDTVVLEADYNELHKFYRNCQRSKQIKDLEDIDFHYSFESSVGKTSKSNKEYQLVNNFEANLKVVQ